MTTIGIISVNSAEIGVKYQSVQQCTLKEHSLTGIKESHGMVRDGLLFVETTSGNRVMATDGKETKYAYFPDTTGYYTFEEKDCKKSFSL
ncbi:hypothetical protein [Escherichia phage pEC-N1203-2Af.1]|nr:hypothetical protein [Escherichia phage pEC-N1203-2Af.1]